ncbi:MAG: TolC family protein [Saprospiraceae bacterium]|uniref:TolC family protein n=1 Tax=Candidatus Defluviibacterium haderslevense TaxID=2981993 RepID=A0A9D7S7C8_9BACT|nr:TolC family protein [Candidatus Defluviibacterium haderslevense]
MKIKITFCVLWIIGHSLCGQENWSLKKCIQHAVEHNLSLKQSELSVKSAAINLKESKFGRLPNLNAGINPGVSFGRNIDPTTNSFITENIFSGNYSLSTNVPIYQGGLINNTIKFNSKQVEASKEDYQQSVNDISLKVANDFLTVLLSQERLEISKQNFESVKQQLDQTTKLIKAGSKPEGDLLDLKSQLAKAEQTVVGAENGLDLSWLQLKQTLRLDPSYNLVLEKLTDDQLRDIEQESYTFEHLFSHAEKEQHGIKAAYLKWEAAKFNEKIAKGQYKPSILANGYLGSRYSDAAKQITGYTLTNQVYPGTKIDGKSVVFEQLYPEVSGTEVIPLNLSQQIAQSLANVKAAVKEYEAAGRTVEFATLSRNNTQRKFEIGSSSTLELNLAQNALQSASLNLIIAKYDLLFKRKVLDFYAGKELKL